jgi:hypothetical protein
LTRIRPAAALTAPTTINWLPKDKFEAARKASLGSK